MKAICNSLTGNPDLSREKKMSIHDAMAFIQKVAEERTLQQKIQALDDEGCLADIVKIGIEAGFEFSEEELRTAFANDWDARYTFYTYLKRV